MAHGEKWADKVQCLSTVRLIRDALTKELKDHAEIVESIDDPEARADFEEVFASDVARCEAVIETCRKRLETEAVG